MQEHVFKIYVQDSILAQIIKTCWNANLEIFFAENILNVAVISIISDILKLFFLIYFILKGLFFLYYFTWCWFVIFMITFFLLINYFANLNSLAVFWNVEFEIKLEHSCLICHALFLSKNESFMFRSFHFFPVELVNENCSKFSSVYNFLVSTIIVFLCCKSICMFKGKLNKTFLIWIFLILKGLKYDTNDLISNSFYMKCITVEPFRFKDGQFSRIAFGFFFTSLWR